MAASNTSKTTEVPATTAAEQDEVDALFNEDDFEGLDDLLDKVEEDDSEGWNPAEPSGIVGIVTKVGVTRSDFATSEEDAMVPTITLETKDGTKWRVIGYASVLKREMNDQKPEIGDRVAVKYFGEKIARNGKYKGKPYKHYGMVVQRKR